MILTKENIKSINLDHLIDNYIKEEKSANLLMVVPTNRKLRDLKKEFISLSPKKIVFKLNIETLSTLTEKLLLANESFIPLSEAASTVLIKRSSEKLQLKYFSNYTSEIPFGTLEKIKNVISRYKETGVTPAKLRIESDNLSGSDKLKALDIALIFENYQILCGKLNAYEIGDVYEALNKLKMKEFEYLFKKNFPDVDLTIINGFDEFTPLETEIINKVSVIHGNRLFINFDYYKYNPNLFSHLDKCYDALEIFGFKTHADNSPSSQKIFSTLVRENLFLDKSKKISSSYVDSIQKIVAFDRNKEIDHIAKEIKLLLSEGIQPNSICIVFNLINNYSSVVRLAFNRYGIPFNLTDRIALDLAPPVITLINVLDILQSDFNFKSIVKAFSGNYVDNHRIDITNLLRAARKLKIVSGNYKWKSFLKQRIEYLRQNDSDEFEIASEMISAEKALEDILLMERLLKQFSKNLSIDDFIFELKRLAISLKLNEKLLLSSRNSEQNIKSVSFFFETLEEILSLIKLEEGSDKKYDLHFYLKQIKVLSGWARFNVKEKSDYGVLVTSINEIRGLNFDYLFIGGMIDGDFPTRFSPEFFFSGQFQKLESAHQSEERYHFYQTLCVWNKRLYLSTALTDKSKELSQSLFLTDFETLFQITEKNFSDFENIIASGDEFLIFTGKKGLRNLTEKEEKLLPLKKDILQHKIDVNEIRHTNPFEENIYNGFLLSGGADSNLSAEAEYNLRKYAEREFSMSQLEIYAKCPFKYFLERALKIESAEEPTEEIEALEIGSILHSIFYEFYAWLKESSINLNSASSTDLKAAEKKLFEIAERKTESSAFNSPYNFYDKEKIFGLGGNKRESILFKFLEEEQSESSFLPSFFEVKFGNAKGEEFDSNLSSETPVYIDDIKLRGKIDRVDMNSGSSSFEIVDYKLSGKTPTKDDHWSGISLQLPIYLFAVKSLLFHKYGREFLPENASIYSLKYQDGKFGKKHVSIKFGKESNAEKCNALIESSLNHVKSIVGSISSGKFSLSSLDDREKKVCNYCDFKGICRVDELLNSNST